MLEIILDPILLPNIRTQNNIFSSVLYFNMTDNTFLFTKTKIYHENYFYFIQYITS
jgi:hypothetical protein